MTKQDFELVADVLCRWVGSTSLRALLFQELATRFKQEYPNFDENKWYRANVSHKRWQDVPAPVHEKVTRQSNRDVIGSRDEEDYGSD